MADCFVRLHGFFCFQTLFFLHLLVDYEDFKLVNPLQKNANLNIFINITTDFFQRSLYEPWKTKFVMKFHQKKGNILLFSNIICTFITLRRWQVRLVLDFLLFTRADEEKCVEKKNKRVFGT